MPRPALLLAILSLAAAGCLQGEGAGGDADPTPPTSGGTGQDSQALVPTDASWPDVAPDPAALSNLSPRALRLETAWPAGWGEPVNATLWLVTPDGEAPLDAHASLGSANGGPGVTGRETLTLNLTGGLAALRAADPSLVEDAVVAFAGAEVVVPTLARAAELAVRGERVDADGARHAFSIPLSLAPREADLVVSPPRYDPETGDFAIPAHPGGHLHPLEDGALHAWAADGRVVALGAAGSLPPPGPPALDLLVLTGMGGGVLRVEGA